MGLTLPKLTNLRPRYSFVTDDQPAAKLAKSMLRLGISNVEDWRGSAVDFVDRGLSRFCGNHGIKTVSKVFPDSRILLADDFLDHSDYGVGSREDAGPSSRLFLLVDYHGVAMVQTGCALGLLGSIDESLPAAFFQVLTGNLDRWMRTYSFEDAATYAETQLEVLDEEETRESFYPSVPQAKPACLTKLPEYEGAVKLLRRALPAIKDERAAELLRLCLLMHAEGRRYDLAYPGRLRKELPEIDDYLENTDPPLPGALIVAEEDDLIEACFNEDMQYLGQEYSISATLMLVVHLEQRAAALDRAVSNVFDHIGAMLRSLAVAAELIQKMRRLYDGGFSQGGKEPGVQIDAGDAAVRGERL